MSAKPAGESLENARKLYSIYARTVQYFGECFLYNSNSIFAYSNKTSSNAWSTQGLVYPPDILGRMLPPRARPRRLKRHFESTNRHHKMVPAISASRFVDVCNADKATPLNGSWTTNGLCCKLKV